MKQVQVPDWARDVVWYQIFPERFRNGCASSNPEISDFSVREIPGWCISDWGQDWYGLADWESKVGGFFQSVYSRRFGGDLVGVREKLDYLQELGVTGIYLNPIFHAQSLHKYDATSYHHIDPTLGPDRAGDLRMIAEAQETDDPATWVWTAADRFFVELVKDIHERGMRVIIDGVFNHTGKAFFAFQDLLKNGKKSRYRGWYRVRKWHDDGRFDYKGWFGVKDLPELGRRKGNLKPAIRDYIHHITRRWMDPHGNGDLSYGIDGWRLDVAFCVPTDFWREWRKVVKGINPEAYTTAEIVADARAYLQGDQFDAVMNYMWAYPVTDFFIRGTYTIGSTACREKLQALLDAYPQPVNGVLQNLLDSHDTARILTIIANPDRPKSHWDDYFCQFRLWNHRDLETFQPGAAEKAVLRQLIMMQMTFLGAPMLYYGTEAGMWGANDPDDRQPMLWDDLEYEQQERNIHGEVRAVIRRPDGELFAFCQRAIRLRKEHPALRHGAVEWLDCGDERVLGFVRRHEDQAIAVLFNVADEAIRVNLPFTGNDLWRGERIEECEKGIPVRSWVVVSNEDDGTDR
jgi:glycosidase